MTQYCLSRNRLLEAAAQLSARQYSEALARFYWDGTVNLGQEAPAPRGESIPWPLSAAAASWQMHVLDAIESAGGTWS